MLVKLLGLVIVGVNVAAVFLAPQSYAGIFPWLSFMQLTLTLLALVLASRAAWVERNEGQARRPWIYLGAGLISAFIAITGSAYLNFFTIVPAQYPSPADFVWLASYVVFALALVATYRAGVAKLTSLERTALVISVAVFTAASFWLWVPSLFSMAADLVDQTAILATPLLDLLVFIPAVAILIRESTWRKWNQPQFWLALGGLMLVAGDITFAVTSWRGWFNPIIDFFWLLTFSAWCWAGTLHIRAKRHS